MSRVNILRAKLLRDFNLVLQIHWEGGVKVFKIDFCVSELFVAIS